MNFMLTTRCNRGAAGVPCLTSMDTVGAILSVIESMTFKMEAM